MKSLLFKYATYPGDKIWKSNSPILYSSERSYNSNNITGKDSLWFSGISFSRIKLSLYSGLLNGTYPFELYYGSTWSIINFSKSSLN